MPIILKRNPLNADQDINPDGFDLAEAPGGYLVTTQFGEQEVLLADLFSPNDAKIGMIDYIGRLVVFDYESWLGQRDFASFIETHLAIKNKNPAFFLYFDATAQDHVMICYRNVKTSLPHTVRAVHSRPPEDIAVFYPVGAGLLEARRVAKTKALQVNLVDSLVALEQQVDVLTRLVMALAEDAPTRPTWYPAFKSAITAGSVERLMPIPSLITAFSEHKNMVRDVQTEYFTQRGIPRVPRK
jgi:hypothetical protein